jgi:DNA-binding GntR family transcriptional regulator
MPRVEEVLPKYLQVANHYRDQILSGSLAAGAELPSERQLAIQWEISRPTATRALAALRNQGLVESRQGSGTFVRGQVVFARRARDRYLRARDAGRIYGPGERAEIVEAGPAVLPQWVAQQFGESEGVEGLHRVRVTYTDEEPSEVSVSWFPRGAGKTAPRLLLMERIRSGTVAYLEDMTGRHAAYARDQLAARRSTTQERQLLNLSTSNDPVMAVRHVVYDDQDQAMECVEAAYPPDHWTFEQQYPISG